MNPQPRLPAYLFDKLYRAGRIRAAHPARCPNCHAHILTGLDANLAAGEAHVDPATLNIAQELAAALCGIDTYTAEIRDHHTYLHYRDGANRPRFRNWPILPAHRCGVKWPNKAAPKPAPTVMPDTPPF